MSDFHTFTNGSGTEELARLRDEQRRLRARQDALEKRVQRKAKAPKEEQDDKDDEDEKGEEQEGEENEDEGEKSKGSKGKGNAKKGKDEDDKRPFLQKVKDAAKAHPVRAIAIVVGVVVALVSGVLFYLHTLTYEDTDDAEIDGDLSAVSTRITGTVVGVYVIDNQVVHAGDPIADLDPRDYDTALAQARAGLAQAEAQLKTEQPNVPITTETNRSTISTSSEDVATAIAELASAERELAQANAQVAQTQANDRYAQVESKRMARLAAVGAVAVSQSDQRTSAADATAAGVEAQQQAALAAQKKVDEERAKLAAARTRLEQAKANAPQQLEARRAAVSLREAAVTSARAQLEQAELNRSYTHIVAPVDGIIGKKSINIGDRIQPGQQLVAITQTANLWVTANFRETQLRKMHAGQHVGLHVDSLDLDLDGEVQSMAGATGSRYSLLPPENATGNFVKVVQRLPVRIKLDPHQSGYERLRPGMSVEPKVTVK